MGQKVIRIDRKTLELQAIYDDRLLPMLAGLRERLGMPPGSLELSRASHVEPAPANDHGSLWSVDLTPLGGPAQVLVDEAGGPFVTHAAALAYEQRWIETHWLGKKQERPNAGTDS